MKMRNVRRGPRGPKTDPDRIPGIVITDGGVGFRRAQELPRLRAFIYGESEPTAPTLPFGRWKSAS